MTAYDLANYNGRLIALGDQCGAGRATDVFELVSQTPAAWRATAGSSTSTLNAPLGRATDVREIGRIADLANGVDNVHVAVGGGLVCAVANLTDRSVVIHIFNPTTDQTVLLSTVTTFETGRVCFAGSAFVIVGKSGTTMVARRFIPASDETVGGALTIATGVAAGNVTDVAVAQTGASDFSVVWADSGTRVDAVRCNSTGAVQATWNVTTTDDARSVGICGNAGGTRISILRQRGADGTYRLNTYDQAGTPTVGPTTLFTGAGTVYTRGGLVQDGTLQQSGTAFRRLQCASDLSQIRRLRRYCLQQ